MAGRLQLDRSQENLRHFVETISPRRTQRATYVKFVVIEQAKMKLPVGGEPHPVTGTAIRFAHRADKADDAAAAANLKLRASSDEVVPASSNSGPSAASILRRVSMFET
jgi:hypothetical protein